MSIAQNWDKGSSFTDTDSTSAMILWLRIVLCQLPTSLLNGAVLAGLYAQLLRSYVRITCSVESNRRIASEISPSWNCPLCNSQWEDIPFCQPTLRPSTSNSMFCTTQHVSHMLSAALVLYTQIPLFNTLHRHFKMPNVHSTSIPKDSSHWENRISERLHVFFIGGTIVGQFKYPLSTITYAPLIVIVVAAGSSWAWTECCFLSSNDIVEFKTPFCSFIIKESKRIRVLSFHLPGWPVVECKICRRWFTVKL